MSFLLMLKKSNQVRIWTTVDRDSLKLIDFEVGDASISTWLNIVFRLKEKYKGIKHL